ncbi:hypothetical protein [Photobacterium leiognathi]|uniref:hypothetical protein n=1 Tax=Photobacterium leiognathi TaxID=553611 RepID=UPI002735F80C|nr:hypothetical protein [Photobacterium leiognathi]
MGVKFLLKNILYIMLLAPTLLQAASDLRVRCKTNYLQKVFLKCTPLLIDKNGEKIISDIKFCTNDKVLLNKLRAENEPRRLLTTTIDNYIAKSNVILHKIDDDTIDFPDLATKNKARHR